MTSLSLVTFHTGKEGLMKKGELFSSTLCLFKCVIILLETALKYSIFHHSLPSSTNTRSSPPKKG